MLYYNSGKDNFMKILVISDTHGNLEKFKEVLNKLKKESPVDMIVHCGDYYNDAMAIRRYSGVPVTAVKGNCDNEFSENGYAVLSTEAGDLLITHGHMENVGSSLQRLFYKTLEYGCVGALFGHTHRAVFTELEDPQSDDGGKILMMNPGSLPRPRDGSGGTFGLIKTSEAGISGRILRYDEFMDEKKESGTGKDSKSPKSGRLRRLLNYSDRF